MVDVKLHDEAARLAALERYDILDSPKEASFDRITGLVKALLNVPMCSISMIDKDRQWFKSCIGLPVSETARDVSFCTHTIKTREPMLIEDASLDPRFQHNQLVIGEPYIRSYLGIPLSTPDGYNVGSLCAIDVKPRVYSVEQIALLTSLAALVIDEFELRRIAQTDHLTGAATRRSFYLGLERALADRKRTGKVSSLVLIDFDHFKHINDMFGHPVGDLVLKSLASYLMADLRPDDHFGRLGGEEFGVLLRGTPLLHAIEVAERFRTGLANMRIPHDPALHVTASFGLSTTDSFDLSPAEWIAEADAALYDAKRNGRNRCCYKSSAHTLV